MKFYGYGVVWDADNDKPLCEFKVDDKEGNNIGVLETNSKKITKKLTDLGYACEDGSADSLEGGA